ncbi:MAG: lysophospholipid acyltransferase family protein, partial [Balneolaceae bacterium]|nr:lysophospholipid acyltransferase family protein [Balneolaceae bacterium]
KPVDPWRNRLLKHWSRGVCKILNIKLSVRGEAPKPPFVIVSNHVSYLDVVPLYGVLDCTFIAKQEIRSWPLIGYMAKTLGVIFIDRSLRCDVDRVNREQMEKLNDHQGVLIFPEGTTSDGSQILRLRSPLLQTAIDANLPVHAATLYYETGESDLPANESVCWYTNISLAKHAIRLAKTTHIDCVVTFSPEAVSSDDRKILASKLQSLMREQFTPMKPGVNQKHQTYA